MGTVRAFLVDGFVCTLFVVHVIQVALAGWANFRSMITGYDIIDTVDAEREQATDKVKA